MSFIGCEWCVEGVSCSWGGGKREMRRGIKVGRSKKKRRQTS